MLPLTACGSPPSWTVIPVPDGASPFPPEDVVTPDDADAARVDNPDGDADTDAAPDAPPAPVVPALWRGTWYLDEGTARTVLTLEPTADGTSLAGTIRDEAASGSDAVLTDVAWDPATGLLHFRRALIDGSGGEWYRLSAVDGVLAGRTARDAGAREPAIAAFASHVTGWNSAALDQDIAPRAYDLMLGGDRFALLRLDRAAPPETGFVGSLKVYASTTRGSGDEADEYDIQVLEWDGTNLVFLTFDGEQEWMYTAVASGRSIAGSYIPPESTDPVTFTGTRADVLAFGLEPRSSAALAAWQDRSRRALAHLIMADDPAPLALRENTLAADVAPGAVSALAPDRDDDTLDWPASYTLTEFELFAAVPNPYGADPLVRRIHGYVARPTTSVPPSGYPVAIVLNGHYGSAAQTMDPNQPTYWYGDAFARRGYLVVSIDVGHRPLQDRGGLYTDMQNGDDPATGNSVHPAIEAPDMDSDWAEDGERVWDAQRAIDYAVSMPDADTRAIVAVGLSMGGEVATLLGAIDPRVVVTVAAGFSPDLGVVAHHNNHPCWQWAHGSAREYVDVSDYHALIAPRALVVETGKADTTFSSFATPFSSDKQVLRRSRAAYGDAVAALVHYLHYDVHHFHVGDVDSVRAVEPNVRVPTALEPDVPWSLGWQSDGTTVVGAPTLFDLLTGALGGV